jgi:hypothetical protein
LSQFLYYYNFEETEQTAFLLYKYCYQAWISFSSSSSGHEVRPINDLIVLTTLSVQ